MTVTSSGDAPRPESQQRLGEAKEDQELPQTMRTLYIRSMWAKAQKGPRGQLPDCCISLHLVDL